MSGGPASPVVDEHADTVSGAPDEDLIFVRCSFMCLKRWAWPTKAGVRIGVAGLSIVYITFTDFHCWTKQNRIRLMHHTPII